MYFEYVTASGGYRANIKGDNHQLRLQTETYTSKASAQNAINVVKEGASSAPSRTRPRASSSPGGEPRDLKLSKPAPLMARSSVMLFGRSSCPRASASRAGQRIPRLGPRLEATITRGLRSGSVGDLILR
jgi:uncharacterized protein YegP (UPF0339 family)